MANLILCDGSWSHSGSGWECSGAITQVTYFAPVEFTSQMALESFFHGFATVVPVLLVIFGGRQILKMLR